MRNFLITLSILLGFIVNAQQNNDQANSFRIDLADSMLSNEIKPKDYKWLIDDDAPFGSKSHRVSYWQDERYWLSRGFKLDSVKISGSTTKMVTLYTSDGDSLWFQFIDLDTDTDTQLDESQVDAFVANNGYSTTDTTLTEAEVDAYVANNGYVSNGDNISSLTNDSGYLTSEVDGSTTNEIQDISLVGTDLSISGGSTVDLSGLSGGIGSATSTTLPDAAVYEGQLRYVTDSAAMAFSNGTNWINLLNGGIIEASSEITISNIVITRSVAGVYSATYTTSGVTEKTLAPRIQRAWVTGTAQDGQTLTCNVDAFDPHGRNLTYTYQWYEYDAATKGSTILTGETNSTYVADTDNIGAKIYCIVTATASSGTRTTAVATSEPSDTIQA